MRWLEVKFIQKQEDLFKKYIEELGSTHTELETRIRESNEDELIKLDLEIMYRLVTTIQNAELVEMELALYHHAIICQEFYEKRDIHSKEKIPCDIDWNRQTLYKIFDALYERFQRENCTEISKNTSLNAAVYQELFPLAMSNVEIESFRLTSGLYGGHENPDSIPYFYPRLMESQIKIASKTKNAIAQSPNDCSLLRKASLEAYNLNRLKNKRLQDIIGVEPNIPITKYLLTPYFQLLKNFSHGALLIPSPLIPRGSKITEENVLNYHLSHLMLLIYQLRAHIRRCKEHVFVETVHNSLRQIMLIIHSNMKEIQALLRIDKENIVCCLNNEILSLLGFLSLQEFYAINLLPVITIRISEYLPSLAFEELYPERISIPTKNSVYFRLSFSHKVFELLKNFFSFSSIYKDHNLAMWEEIVFSLSRDLDRIIAAYGSDSNSQKVTSAGLKLLAYFLFVHNNLFNNATPLDEFCCLMGSLLPHLQESIEAVKTILFFAASECIAKDPLESHVNKVSVGLYNSIAARNRRLEEKGKKQSQFMSNLRLLSGKKNN